MELAPHVQVVRLDNPVHVTTSDHEALSWGVTTVVAPEEYDTPTRGWAVGEWLEDEDRAQKEALDWHHRSEPRPLLSSHCSKEEVEEEAVWIRLQLIEMLDQSARRIRITAQSKRWWSLEVKSARQTYGRTRRGVRQGEAMEEQECLARNAYLRIQRSKKRHCWGSFLETANGDAVWQVLRCTNPCTTTAMGTMINEHGNRTEEDQEKRCMMAAISFPAANDYDGREGYPGPPGTVHTLVTEELVHSAISHQSNSKAPGRDSLGVPIIKALLKWDPK
jgi:hypothetical protein